MDPFVAYTPVHEITGDEGGDVVQARSTVADAVKGKIRLAPASSRGTLAVARLPVFQPATDLQPIEPSDLPLGPDGHPTMPEEHWPKRERPPLLNVGGNRLLVAGQPATFDARDAQGDEDGAVADCAWDFGDGGTASGLTVTHTYDEPGTYLLEATSAGVVAHRRVRVLAAMGDSDGEVVALPDFGGDLQTGWHCTVEITDDASDWEDFQGIILYVWDDTNVGWRDGYRARFRDLARRTAYPATPPPAPNPIGDHADPVLPGPDGNLGNPAGWENVNRWNAYVADAARKTGVPGNLIKAHMKEESDGNPDCKTGTDNPDCPYAIGLMQIAPGCSWFDHLEKDLWDPAQNILAGAQEIRARYDQCTSWEGAVVAYFAGHCDPDGSQDSLGTVDSDYGRTVLEYWQVAEDAARTGTGGGAEPTPRFGEVIFNGYVVAGGVSKDSDRSSVRLQCVGTAEILGLLMRRQEAFFETATGHTAGGTFVDAPPMRTAQVIHHTLVAHSNFAEWHDCVLDWSGPRVAATTANEGTMLAGFRAWADNDFGRVISDRRGALLQFPLPHYRGKRWYDEAIAYAPAVDPGLVTTLTVQERIKGQRVTWVKFSGTMPQGNCQVFGEYPCGGPPGGPAGAWVTRTGFQHDDEQILGAMAAHHYSYLNRTHDVAMTMHWRHDLELGDVLRLPFTDVMTNGTGRFDWRSEARYVVVTAISYAYETQGATWLTTVNGEELSYGMPCEQAPPECHQTRQPCPTCPPPCLGCAPGGYRPGDPACATSGTLNPSAWKVFRGTQNAGGSGLDVAVESFPLGTTTFTTYACGCTVIPIPFFPFTCSVECHQTATTSPDGAVEGSRFRFDGFSIPAQETSTIGLGEHGVLAASFAEEVADFGGGGGSASNTTRRDTVAWVEVVATGPVGSTLVGSLLLAPWESEIGGTADVVVAKLTPDGEAVPPTVPDGVDGLVGVFAATDALHPLRYGTVVGRVDAFGINTIGKISTEIPLKLACAPQGQRYGIGLVCRDGPQDSAVAESVLIEVASHAISQQPGWISVDGVSLCGPSCSHTGDCVTASATDYYNAYIVGPGLTPEDYAQDFVGDGACPEMVDNTVAKTYRMVSTTDTWHGEVTCDATLTFSGCRWETNGVPGSPSHGSGGFGGSHGQVTGTCGNWPTAQAIDDRIAQSGAANGRSGPLAGQGATFLDLGRRYGINPGFVTALLQRESQLATDGSTLPTVANNFAGMTGLSGPCGTLDTAGHTFIKFCSAADGLEAVFDRLANVSAYTSTDGSVEAILNVWAPCFENDCAEGLAVMASVAGDLGITLAPSTSVYSHSGECQDPAFPTIPAQPNGSDQIPLEWALHQAGGHISQGPYGSYSHQICDCHDFGVPEGTPIYALLPGTVVVSESTDGVYTPNHVIVETAYGNVHYAHFIQRLVEVGQRVEITTQLGYSGSAGTGAHLHLGLDGGTSNYTLDQLFTIAGFKIGGFPWE